MSKFASFKSVKSFICTNPEVPPAVFTDRKHDIIAESIFRGVVGKLVIFKTIQAIIRTNPEVSLPVFMDGPDKAVG